MKQKHSKEIEWTRLENASKVFPATWNLKDTKVFRLTCELFEAVDPDVLQQALDQTILEFPLYRSVLRHGLFWYYLESSELKPVVSMESEPVCAPIYIGRKSNLLFRVVYFNNRINLEVFHALSDGSGAIRFLQALVYHYLTVRHKNEYEDIDFEHAVSSISGQMDDSFGKHFNGGSSKEKKTKEERAYRIHGAGTIEHRLNLIEGSMSLKQVLEEAHRYDTKLTVFITSLFLYAISKEMPARRKKERVVLTVPVNLRQFFESETARNFFSYINIGYCFEDGDGGLETVIRSVSESFKNNLTKEQVGAQANKYVFLEHSIFTRVVPLPIKDIIIRATAKSSDRYTTSNISNIGQITMPPEFRSAIRQFCVCTSARRPQMTMCSYGDRLVISITSPFRETDLQRTFYKLLSSRGISIEISTSN